MIDGMLTREPSLTSRRPNGKGTQPLWGGGLPSMVPHDYVNEPDRKLPMADLNDLADEAATELLKAIRDQAPKASDSKLLNLAQAFSLVVSAEVTAELVDEDDTWEAEEDEPWEADEDEDEQNEIPQEPASLE
jgi:hypothetical protein